MGVNILIVDDSNTMRAVIKRTLAISGLDVGEVYEASNGIEALARMASHPVGVVLLDINMPVMNGVQLVKRIRDDPNLRDIPVIITSTEGSEARIEDLMRAGARGYVRKPFRPEQLRDALTPFVGLARVTASEGAPDDDLAF